MPDLCDERLYQPTIGTLYRGIKKKLATQPTRRSARKGSQESYPLSSPVSDGCSGKVCQSPPLRRLR